MSHQEVISALALALTACAGADTIHLAATPTEHSAGTPALEACPMLPPRGAAFIRLGRARCLAVVLPIYVAEVNGNHTLKKLTFFDTDRTVCVNDFRTQDPDVWEIGEFVDGQVTNLLRAKPSDERLNRFNSTSGLVVEEGYAVPVHPLAVVTALPKGVRLGDDQIRALLKVGSDDIDDHVRQHGRWAGVLCSHDTVWSLGDTILRGSY